MYNVYFHYQNQSYQIMSYHNYDFEIFNSYMQSKQTLPLMVYMVHLIMVKLTILKLILVQLPMQKLIKIKTNHN